MRYDSTGLFWQDTPAVKVPNGPRKLADRSRPLPPIPKTNWFPPGEFPNLSAAKRLSIDVESRDDDLMEKGPGYQRGAYIVGLAVGTDDGYRAYFPMKHELGGNMDAGQVVRWANDELGRANQPKVGARMIYDLEALHYTGVKVAGKCYDIQLMAPLLNENRYQFNLELLSQEEFGEGKQDEELYKWLAKAYGGQAKRIGKTGQARNIWRGPVSLVGPYAESDIDLPLRLFDVYKPRLEEEGLWDLFEMESDLIPMLLAMRLEGVRVDAEGAERLNDDLKKRLKNVEGLSGLDIWAAESIAKVFRKAGEPFPLTPKTKEPSFTKDWLERHHWDVARKIAEARKWDKFRATFLEGYILNSHIGGRVYGQFHPLKSDEGGTVSGRFSSSCPNLQNIPKRDKELGPLVRSLFIPEDDEDWVKDDYSQVEFRILTHYAEGPEAEDARRRYWEDPSTDFHIMVAEMCDIARGPAKNINFGLVYCMGEEMMATNLGRPVEEIRPIFDQYHEKLPFVKALQEELTKLAERQGFVRTILGRRARFDLYEPRNWELSRQVTPKPYDEALAAWKRIKRAGTYKALNRRIQGSAADVMKEAMRQIWKAGICNALKAPRLTVHDELDWSRPRTPEALEAHREAIHIMEHCVELRVPLKVDSGVGPNWGSIE